MRQDNADLRLTEKSYALGLAKSDRLEQVLEKKSIVNDIKEFLSETSVAPEEINEYLEKNEKNTLKERQKMQKLLLRPEISINDLILSIPSVQEKLKTLNSQEIEQAEIQIKYQVYLDKEKELVQKMNQMDDLKIPENFQYNKLTALSTEARQKLSQIRPHTLGQAGRISGVNPSDIQILMVYMGR